MLKAAVHIPQDVWQCVFDFVPFISAVSTMRRINSITLRTANFFYFPSSVYLYEWQGRRMFNTIPWKQVLQRVLQNNAQVFSKVKYLDVSNMPLGDVMFAFVNAKQVTRFLCSGQVLSDEELIGKFPLLQGTDCKTSETERKKSFERWAEPTCAQLISCKAEAPRLAQVYGALLQPSNADEATVNQLIYLNKLQAYQFVRQLDANLFQYVYDKDDDVHKNIVDVMAKMHSAETILIVMIKLPMEMNQVEKLVSILNIYSPTWKGQQFALSANDQPLTIGKLLLHGASPLLLLRLCDRYDYHVDNSKMFAFLDNNNYDYSQIKDEKGYNLLYFMITQATFKPNSDGTYDNSHLELAQSVLKTHPLMCRERSTTTGNVLHWISRVIVKLSRANHVTNFDSLRHILNLVSKHVDLRVFANEYCLAHGTVARLLSELNHNMPRSTFVEEMLQLTMDWNIDWHSNEHHKYLLTEVKNKELFQHIIMEKPEMYSISSPMWDHTSLFEQLKWSRLQDDVVLASYTACYNTTVDEILLTQYKGVRYCDMLFEKLVACNNSSQCLDLLHSIVILAVQRLCGKSIATDWARRDELFKFVFPNTSISALNAITPDELDHFMAILLQQPKWQNCHKLNYLLTCINGINLPAKIVEMMQHSNVKESFKRCFGVQYKCTLCNVNRNCYNDLQNHFRSTLHKSNAKNKSNV